jgi:hypothetical protein
MTNVCFWVSSIHRAAAPEFMVPGALCELFRLRCRPRAAPLESGAKSATLAAGMAISSNVGRRRKP